MLVVTMPLCSCAVSEVCSVDFFEDMFGGLPSQFVPNKTSGHLDQWKEDCLRFFFPLSGAACSERHLKESENRIFRICSCADPCLSEMWRSQWLSNISLFASSIKQSANLSLTQSVCVSIYNPIWAHPLLANSQCGSRSTSEFCSLCAIFSFNSALLFAFVLCYSQILQHCPTISFTSYPFAHLSSVSSDRFCMLLSRSLCNNMHLSVCLSVCLSVSLSLSLSVYLSPSLCLSVSLSSLSLSLSLSVFSVSLSLSLTHPLLSV